MNSELSQLIPIVAVYASLLSLISQRNIHLSQRAREVIRTCFQLREKKLLNKEIKERLIRQSIIFKDRYLWMGWAAILLLGAGIFFVVNSYAKGNWSLIVSVLLFLIALIIFVIDLYRGKETLQLNIQTAADLQTEDKVSDNK